jgi:hypothetical protein
VQEARRVSLLQIERRLGNLFRPKVDTLVVRHRQEHIAVLDDHVAKQSSEQPLCHQSVDPLVADKCVQGRYEAFLLCGNEPLNTKE